MIDIPDDKRVTFINKMNPRENWKKWKTFGECSEKEKKQANLREILNNEIVLDIDAICEDCKKLKKSTRPEKCRECSNVVKEKFETMLKRIKDDGYTNYIVLDTGSRGHHIHLFFDNLVEFEKVERKKIRERFITNYDADISKASENTLISIENTPHFKTQRLSKIIINESGKLNHLNDKYLVKVIIEEKQNTCSGIEELDIADVFGVDKVGSKWQGEHFIHGSEGGNNLDINFDKNVWHCFRCNSGGGVASAIAMLEGLINCKDANKKLDKEIFKKVIKIAREKYGLKDNIGKETDLSQIELPKEDIPISEFATEVGSILRDKKVFFYRPDLKKIVEIITIEKRDKNDKIYSITDFDVIHPKRFVTLAEKYFTPGYLKKEEGEFVFKKKSMSESLSGLLLRSPMLGDSLLRIDRIFSVPIPILYHKELTFPKIGYDSRFNSWLSPDAATISNPNMNVKEAKAILADIFSEFPFKKNADFINSIASLLTPFLRGLYSAFNIRSPLIIYTANQSRSGKDENAKVRMMLYEGIAIEESPISSNDKYRGSSSEEFTKRLVTYFKGSRRILHFSNNRGMIKNAAFESVLTTSVFNNRLLGVNDSITADNEFDFSISGNTGMSYTLDIVNRSIFINLFLDLENPNSRVFKRPDFINWVKNNRGQILSALYSLVRHWISKGKPPGKIPFATCHEWAEICGGIMECAEYSNPAIINMEFLETGGDEETRNVKELWLALYEAVPEKWIKYTELKTLINEHSDWPFHDLIRDSIKNKSAQQEFAKIIRANVGRIFNKDIRLIDKDIEKPLGRRSYKFTKNLKKISITDDDTIEKNEPTIKKMSENLFFEENEDD